MNKKITFLIAITLCLPVHTKNFLTRFISEFGWCPLISTPHHELFRQNLATENLSMPINATPAEIAKLQKYLHDRFYYYLRSGINIRNSDGENIFKKSTFQNSNGWRNLFAAILATRMEMKASQERSEFNLFSWIIFFFITNEMCKALDKLSLVTLHEPETQDQETGELV